MFCSNPNGEHCPQDYCILEDGARCIYYHETCGECKHFKHCQSLIFTLTTTSNCDFIPSRFKPNKFQKIYCYEKTPNDYEIPNPKIK